MLFMFKRRIMVCYVDNETSLAEQVVTNLKSRLSQRSSMTSCCLHLREELTIMQIRKLVEQSMWPSLCAKTMVQ